MALEMTSKNFEKEALNASFPVVVDAYAPWCGPCQRMMPIFDELAAEFANTYKLVKLNIDNERDLATKYGIASVPTFLFIKDGKVIGTEMGYMSKDVLKSKIEEILGG